jgi:hypothetical protein
LSLTGLHCVPVGLQDSFCDDVQALIDGDRAQGCARSAASSTDVLSADNTPCEKKKRFLVTFCRSTKSYPPLAAEAFAP